MLRIDSRKLQILGVKLERRGREEGELHRDTVAANRTIGQQGKTKEGGGLKAIQIYI